MGWTREGVKLCSSPGKHRNARHGLPLPPVGNLAIICRLPPHPAAAQEQAAL
jgi:hypothetical protein